MGLFGRNHPRRKRAYMVGYRAGMGEVLLGRTQLTAARRLRVNRVILTVVPATSGLPRSTGIFWVAGSRFRAKSSNRLMRRNATW
jgi:hypothetical protein